MITSIGIKIINKIYGGVKPFLHLKSIVHLCIHLLFSSDNPPSSLNTGFLLSLWPVPEISRAAPLCSLCNLDLLVLMAASYTMSA